MQIEIDEETEGLVADMMQAAGYAATKDFFLDLVFEKA